MPSKQDRFSFGIWTVGWQGVDDPEYHLTFAEAMARGGPVEALTALRDQGVLDHLGVAGGPVRLMKEFIATGEFDAVLSHNRFMLVDRSAGPLMDDDACQRGVAFVNGAPYGGGMLAKGPDVQPKYAYRLTGEVIQGAVRAMQRACAAHGVSLAAAALQFSLRAAPPRKKAAGRGAANAGPAGARSGRRQVRGRRGREVRSS